MRNIQIKKKNNGTDIYLVHVPLALPNCELSESAIRISKMYENLNEYDKVEVDRAIEELKELKLILQLKEEILFLAMPRDKMNREKRSEAAI